MEYVVLGLLLIHNLTLYEINQAFKQGISMFYSASYGSLQIAIKNLLAKELVVFEEKVDRGRNKKVYTITQRGKEAFFTWMLAETPVNKLEVTALSKVYFLGLIQDTEQRKAILRDIILKIELVEAYMHNIEDEIERAEIPADYRPILKFHWKTLDYGQMAHAAAKQWFINLLNEL